MKKYKENLFLTGRGEGKNAEALSPEIPEETGRIIKRKQFDMKPMGPDEAVMMELLGKNFCFYQ